MKKETLNNYLAPECEVIDYQSTEVLCSSIIIDPVIIEEDPFVWE